MQTLVKVDTYVWSATIKISFGLDETIKEREDKEFVMEYKSKLDEPMIRNITYKDNTFKLCALLWERCDKAMQNNIASRLDCDGLVYNNPIALQQAIKEH